MGDDWCRMRVASDVDLDALRRIINAAAEAYRQNGRGFVDDLHAFSPESDSEAAWSHYQVADRRIRAQILIEEDADGHWNCERMSPIGRNDIFPYDWRIAAYRCFLPDEVPAMLTQWHSYIEAVRAGRYHHYLSDWYVYRESRRALEFWQRMQQAASEIHRDQVSSPDVLDHILNLPKPEPLSAPLFIEETREQEINWQSDPRYQALAATFATLHQARHAWNRAVRSRALKFHRSEACFADDALDFDGFVSGAHDSRIDDLFAWLRACVNDEVGLYLWV